MRVVFFGTPEIAIPTLLKLKEYVIAVVTQPDRPSGRGRKITPSPVKEKAISLGIEKIFQPETTKDKKFREDLRILEPDFFVVVAYGKILGKKLLNLPKKGCINLHLSLLPKYRGAAPVAWAILNGDEVTGVTVQKMAPELDAGDILIQKEVEIKKGETKGELEKRLSEIGAELVLYVLENYDKLEPITQDQKKVSFAPVLKKQDGLIDWSQDATIIERKVRAFNPWPSAFTYFNNKLLKIYRAEAVYNDNELKEEGLKPGYGIIKDKECYIKCGKGFLKLLEVQLEGKKKIDILSFINGMRLKSGFILESKKG